MIRLRGCCWARGRLDKYQPSSPRTTHLCEPGVPYDWLGGEEFCCNSQQKPAVPLKFWWSHAFLLNTLSFEAPSTRVLWKSLRMTERFPFLSGAGSSLQFMQNQPWPEWSEKLILSCRLPVLPNLPLSPLTPQDGDVYYHSRFWWQCRDLLSFLLVGVLQGSCWEHQTSSSIHRDQNPPWRDILGVETISFKGKLTRKSVSEQHCWFRSCREQFSSVNMIPRKQPNKPPKGKRSPRSPRTCLEV